MTMPRENHAPQPIPHFRLRTRLLIWIIVPLIVFTALDTYALYGQAHHAANTAYDRSLLASARAIGEEIELDQDRVIVRVPFVALEIFDNDLSSRMVYRVQGLHGEFLSGYPDLPPFRTEVPRSRTYPALVRFYQDTYRGEPVRMAALYQPVSSDSTQGLVLIQVAETMEARQQMTRDLLWHMLIRQTFFILLIVVIVLAAITWTFKPIIALGERLKNRSVDDASSLTDHLSDNDLKATSRELWPFVEAVNHYIARLQHLSESRRRFIADASHQLRTPLGILKLQAQTAQRDPKQREAALESMQNTLQHLTRLSDQLLGLARAEHAQALLIRQPCDLQALAREVCVELAPLALQKNLSLTVLGDPAPVEGDPTLLFEMLLNLVDNAIKHTPAADQNRSVSGEEIFPGVVVSTQSNDDGSEICVRDDGKGIPEEELEDVLRRFYTGQNPAPANRAPGVATTPRVGLGLSIVREICQAHNGKLTLRNRQPSTTGSIFTGLEVCIQIPHSKNQGRSG